MIPVLVLAALSSATMTQSSPIAWTPASLWDAWPQQRFVETAAPCLGYEELGTRLRDLAARHPEALSFQEVGRSYQDRSIHLLTVGHGPFKVLLWSQMHGDEPSATPALLDIADFLLRHAEEPAARAILDRLTLYMVPMLNPDGAERYQRRNAQGIDINRDALNLATPEGRLLKSLRDRLKPELGFNLHDQNRRVVVGDRGVLATASVLAVAGDEKGTVTPGRRRAMRVCSAITRTLVPLLGGGVSRYDEDWSPRAFGDNLTAWGTPIVLLESGGLPPGRDFSDLTRANFVALLVALEALAHDDLAAYDTETYEKLPRNQENSWADVVVRGGSTVLPGAEAPYRADLAFDLRWSDRARAQCGPRAQPTGSNVVEIGDARFIAAGHELDADGAVFVPALVAGAEGWKARHWLDAETLERLGGLGVSTVFWRVPSARLAEAQSLAERLAEPGRARLRPHAGGDFAPALRLRSAPEAGIADSFGDLLEALGGEKLRSELGVIDLGAALERLSGNGGASPLRPGAPASFLVLEPSDEGGAAESAVRSIVIDGVEVHGNALSTPTDSD